jgi:PAS domain S-box-containing protein
MSDHQKTKEELIEELSALRARVSKLEKATELFQESETNYKDLVEGLPDVVYTLDTAGNVTSVNKAGKALFGREPEEVIGKHFSTWILQEDISNAVAVFKRILSGEKITRETVILDRQGQPHNVEFSSAPIIRDGKAVGARGIIRDITDRKKMEKALRDSENTLRAMIHAITQFALLVETDGRVVIASPATAERLGTSEGGLIGKCMYDFLSRDIAESRKRHVDEVIREGKAVHFEDENAGRCIYHSVYPIFDASGNVARLAIFALDFTDRKQAEEKLRQSERRYRALFDDVPVGLGLATMDGRVLDCNKAILQMTGYTGAEIKRINVRDTYQDPQQRVQLLERVCRDGRVEDFEVALKRKDGTTYYASLSIIRWTLGGEDVLLAAQKDITQRKRVEQAVRDSEARLRLMAETVPDYIFQTKRDGTTVYCSPAIQQLLGYSPEERQGHNFLDVILPADLAEAQASFEQVIKGRPLYNVEFSLAHKTGRTVPVEVSVVPVFQDNEVTMLFGVARDITERKQAERRLREAEARYRALVEQVPAISYTAKLDPRSTTVYVSPQFEQILGFARVDYEADPDLWAKQLHPEDRRRVLADVAQCHQTGKAFRCEYRMIAKDGRTVWLRDHASIVSDSNGKPLALHGVMMDITERKLVEETLAESEQKWRSLVENAPDVILTIDPDGTILFLNRAVPPFTPEKAVGTSVYDYVPPAYQDTVRDAIEHVVHTGKPYSYELPGKGPGGRISWYQSRLGPIIREDKVVALILIAADVTEHKQADDALQQSKAKYRTLLENLPQKIFLKDVNSVYISCNENFATDLKIRPEEIAGKTDYDLFSKELADQYKADDKRVVESGQVTEIEETYVGGGQETTVHTVKTPVKDEQGNLSGILGIFWDITEQKKAEEQIRRLSSAVEQSMDGIAIVDLEPKLVYVNSAFARMFGYAPQEMIGIALPELHNAEQMVAHEAHIDRVKAESRWDGELDHVRKDGRTFATYMSVTLLEDNQGQPTGILAVARDITKAKQRERELSLYREKITQAEHLASLGILSAEMVHQLTQPLTVIKLSIQNAVAALEGPRWAGTQKDSSSKLAAGKLDDSLDAISDITSMIDRFRSFARRSSDIRVSRVNLHSVARKIVELLSETARRARITISFEGVDELPAVYMGKGTPEQLFFALIENAIQAADGKEEHTLVIRGSAENRYVTLRFCDDCGGIAPENLERIFEPLFTTKPAGQGTGLGLCVVQRIVSQAGGTIHAESTYGQGTTFTVTLPSGRDVDP